MATGDRLLPVPAGYNEFLRDLKQRIREAQLRAGLAVNRELVLLYWRIGREIAWIVPRDGRTRGDSGSQWQPVTCLRYVAPNTALHSGVAGSTQRSVRSASVVAFSSISAKRVPCPGPGPA